MKRLDVLKSIVEEWENMQCLPVMEFKMVDGGWLTVNISLDDNKHNPAIRFDFDNDNMETWFSGEVQGKGGSYRIRITQYTRSLYELLEQVSEEITEGFLIPNKLYSGE